MLAMLVLGSVVTVENLRTREVVIDATNSDAVYAVGANWKARFIADGVEFTPFLGSDTPRNQYLFFEPSRVTLDGAQLASNDAAGVECRGHTLGYSRGAFDELFEARVEGLEHQLVFRSLPSRGELVVRSCIDSSLTARQAGDAIEFVNERGYVRYPSALVFDAVGQCRTLASRLDGASIVLTVPAEFVRGAVLPLTIDPLIQVFGSSSGPSYHFAPDASFHRKSTGQSYRCEVFETAWSVTDHDVTAIVTRVESGVATPLLVDATQEYWAQPKVASVLDSPFSGTFLIAAAVGHPTSGARTIRAREVRLSAAFGASLQFNWQVDSTVGGDNHSPDVGGDPFPSFADYIVVWQHDQPNGDSDIVGRVHVGGPLLNFVNFSVDPMLDDEHPRLSKANDEVQSDWCVVFERLISPGNRDICASTLQWNSVSPSPVVFVASTPANESNPSVSSQGSAGFVVAYERDMGGHRDIFLQIHSTQASPAINLTLLEGGTHSVLDQRWPSIDGNQTGYLIAYRDEDPLSAGFSRTRFTSFALAPANQIVLDQVRQHVGGPGDPAARTNVCSEASSTHSGNPNFQIVWSESIPPIGSASLGAIFANVSSGAGVESACYGDGAITACPCAQNGGAPTGCPNSNQPTGAELLWTGQARVAADSFVCQGMRLAPNGLVLLVQGTGILLGANVFGDGLLCLSGALTRVATGVTDASGSFAYPGSGTDPTISSVSSISVAGGLRTYQWVYRDPVPYCSAETLNCSNALIANWSP